MDLKFPSKLTNLGEMVGLLRDEAWGEEVRPVGNCLKRVFGMLALPFLFLLFPFLHEVNKFIPWCVPCCDVSLFRLQNHRAKQALSETVSITKFSAIGLVFFVCFIIMMGTTREKHLFFIAVERAEVTWKYFYLSPQFPPSCLPLSLSFSVWWLNSGLHTS